MLTVLRSGCQIFPMTRLPNDPSMMSHDLIPYSLPGLICFEYGVSIGTIWYGSVSFSFLSMFLGLFYCSSLSLFSTVHGWRDGCWFRLLYYFAALFRTSILDSHEMNTTIFDWMIIWMIIVQTLYIYLYICFIKLNPVTTVINTDPQYRKGRHRISRSTSSKPWHIRIYTTIEW